MIPSGIYRVSTMSYLDNGSTLRSMFRLTPPQRHDIDPTRSEIITYIKDNLHCDIGRAIRAFNSMRNKKSQVLVYDMIHRQWRGCDWVPPEDGDQITFLTRTINEMKRELFALKSEVRKHGRVIGQLERKRSRKREEEEPDSDVEAQEQKSSPDVDPEELERKKREEEDAAYDKSSKEFWGAILAEMNDEPVASAASTRPRSSPSGSTAPTQSHLENAEDVVS
jgi:hypothetical protein